MTTLRNTCPICDVQGIYSDLNANYLNCRNCEWKAYYRLLQIDYPITFMVERGYPCVHCGIWVDVDSVIDGFCMECFSHQEEEEGDNFDY